MTRWSLFSVIRTRLLGLLPVVLLTLLIIPIFVHESWTQAAQQTNDHLKNHANSALVNRGRYIVEDVAVCSQCHTPRNGAGGLERGQWLEELRCGWSRPGPWEIGRFRPLALRVLPAAVMLT